MPFATKLEQAPRRNHSACMVPRPVGDGLFEVDSTWGSVQPIELPPGVRTIGEVELIEHLENGRLLVKTDEQSFNVKRIRRHPAVMIAPAPRVGGCAVSRCRRRPSCCPRANWIMSMS